MHGPEHRAEPRSTPRGRMSRMSAPVPASAQVREKMRRQRSADTAPELKLRQALYQRGLRYRVQRRPLPGVQRTSDVVFPSLKIVVDVRGCFWHGCVVHRTIPRNNQEWWTNKIKRIRERDEETEKLLRDSGWQVVVVWEHDDIEQAAEAICKLVRAARSARTPAASA
jgi:DNA mismatch endonuclease, patch repair protein